MSFHHSLLCIENVDLYIVQCVMHVIYKTRVIRAVHCSWYTPDGADSRRQSLILKQSRSIYSSVGTAASHLASNIYNAVS